MLTFLGIIFVLFVAIANFLIALGHALTGTKREEPKYYDPIKKMERDFDTGNLDLEDCFWLDELLGDD